MSDPPAGDDRPSPDRRRWLVASGGFVVVLLLVVAAAAIVRDDDDEPSPGPCDGERAAIGDVDGDGTADAVVHVMTTDGPRLRACTSASGDQEIEGLGTADEVELLDIQDDGKMEITYGSRDGDVRNLQVAVVDEGELQLVMFQNTLDGGDPTVLVPFELQDGHADGPPPEGARSAYACQRTYTGDPVLVTYDLGFVDGEIDARNLSTYELDGAIARVWADSHDNYGVDEAPHTEDLPAELPSDPVEQIDAVVSAVVDLC